MFQNLGNIYLADRADDIFDLEKRILRHLLGERREELRQLTAPVVILAHNLTPGETATLPKDFVLGFATEVGGRTSHTAILAGALEIPAVVGVGDFLSDVAGGEMVVIDGTRGEIIIDPDEETLGHYRDSQARLKTVSERLKSLRQQPSADPRRRADPAAWAISNSPRKSSIARSAAPTASGCTGPSSSTCKAAASRPKRTTSPPTRRVVSAFAGHEVVIRTLDLGADKFANVCGRIAPDGATSVLGLRSLRLTLQNLPLFKTQLRAILRAATSGDVAIMFPLVSSLLELRQAKMILEDVKEDLEDQGVAFKRNVPVGMMVEVPSAALLADEFAREVDFFSIGTNDLIQYTLAVDRSDPDVANLYSSGDPSILRLIRHVVEAARKRDIPVTVCGQMSSDPKFIPLLIGMGIRRLSVTPHSIPELKEVIRTIDVRQGEEIAAHALSLELARDVENYLRGELKKICPDLVT